MLDPYHSEDNGSERSFSVSNKVVFSSNLAAVLNDPRKDRNKKNYLFTKTWGSDFVDSAYISSLKSTHQLVSLKDFKQHLEHFNEKVSKHLHNKIDLSSPNNSKKQNNLLINNQFDDLDQIPKIFFDQNFSLTNKKTFETVLRLNNKLKTNSNNILSDLSNTNSNPFLNAEDAQACKIALDKLSYYLDIIENHITKQISTKANTFFNAIHSQDEVQEHILKTCKEVKSIRKNINYTNQNVILTSIRIIRLVNLKIKYKNLVEKLELMSSVYQTQPAIQIHLASSEFTGALDLISMSQDIVRQELRSIRSLRHYDSQFQEIEKAIDKMLHQEFTKYIINDLSRDFSTENKLLNEEKLSSLILSILRIKTTNFIDLCKDEIYIYLKSTVKQTVIEYISKIDDDDDETYTNNRYTNGTNEDDFNNMKVMDRVRVLKFQEFLHLITKVLSNVRTMIIRVETIIKFILDLLESETNLIESFSEKKSNPVRLRKDLIINVNVQSKLAINLKELLVSTSDYAQERLVNLLEGKFKGNGLEKLNSNDFISLSNLIDQFILDFDQIAKRKTTSLRSWLQNQANKFLHKFHSDRKDKLTLAIESESWKQTEITPEFQILIDNILSNGFSLESLMSKSIEAKSKSNIYEFLRINEEKYVIFSIVIVLLKTIFEYVQLSIDIPNLSYDIMTRLIELFTIFNTKTYKMILGVGAIELGLLRLITFKTLAITYRSLELVLYFLPLIKDFFIENINDKKSNTEKQFNKIITDYKEHLVELNNKLLFMIDDIFRDSLSKYEVIAPVPSQCFRSICSQIERIHQIVIEILSQTSLIQLFTEIHEKFKKRLKDRLNELNILNDGGPKHAMIFQDMTFYIKQFKNLKGLHLISINFLDVWET